MTSPLNINIPTNLSVTISINYFYCTILYLKSSLYISTHNTTDEHIFVDVESKTPKNDVNSLSLGILNPRTIKHIFRPRSLLKVYYNDLCITDEKICFYFIVKVCKKQHILREQKREQIHREKDILNILSSTGSNLFVKLYCTFQDNQRLCILLKLYLNINFYTQIL